MARARHAARLASRPRRVNGLVARLFVTDGPWAEDIPPVPSGFDVTVSFGSQALADEHGDALGLLGYRVVRTPTTAVPLPAVADFLVSESLVEERPTYWASLAAQASRTYHLGFGPVALLMADVVEAHTSPVS